MESDQTMDETTKGVGADVENPQALVQSELALGESSTDSSNDAQIGEEVANGMKGLVRKNSGKTQIGWVDHFRTYHWARTRERLMARQRQTPRRHLRASRMMITVERRKWVDCLFVYLFILSKHF